MAPPPVPWFRGRTIVVAPTQVSGDAISIRALGRHTFTSPSATTELTLPTEMLVLAIAEGPALGFRGIFTGADTTSPLPIDLVLPPVDPDVKKKQRKEAYTERAKAAFGQWLYDSGATLQGN